MPQKLNKAGKMQDYIPKGNGDASGEYGTSNGTNKNFTKPNVIKENTSLIKENKKNVLANKTFYHGSPKTDIKQFDSEKAGSNTLSDFEGIFFTDNKEFADDFSYEQLEGNSAFTRRKGKKGSVYEVDLEMTNPLNLNELTKEQIEDITTNYMKDTGFGKEQSKKWFKEYLDYKNPQGAKMYIDFQKLIKDGKYDGYIADLGGTYKGSNEYVIFKGNQAKIKKENKPQQANVIK